MIKTLQSTLKQDREKYKVPKSVQDIIPIRRIWSDGIFQSGTKFSKSIRFTDINYAIASKALISCTGLGVASVWTFFLLENVAR